MTELHQLVTAGPKEQDEPGATVLRVVGGRARAEGPLLGRLGDRYGVLLGVTASYTDKLVFDVFERNAKITVLLAAEAVIADRQAALAATEAANARGWLTAVKEAVLAGASKAISEAPSPDKRSIVNALLSNRQRVYDAIRYECRRIGLTLSKLRLEFEQLHEWPLLFEKGDFVVQAESRAVDARLSFMLELHPDYPAAYYTTSLPARGAARSIEAEMMTAARKAVDGKFTLQQWRENLPDIVELLTDALNLRARDFGLTLIGRANLQSPEYRPQRPIDLDDKVVHKLLGTPRELTINYRCTLTLDDVGTWEQANRNDPSIESISSFAKKQIERAVSVFLRGAAFSDAVDLIRGRRANGSNPRDELRRYVREELASVLSRYGWATREEFLVVPNDIPESQLIRGEATIHSPLQNYDLSTAPDQASLDVMARAVLVDPDKLVPYLRNLDPIEVQVRVEVEHTIATLLGGMDALAFHRLSTEVVDGRKALTTHLLPRIAATLARYGLELVNSQGADGGLVLRLNEDAVTKRLKSLKNLPLRVVFAGTVENTGRHVPLTLDAQILIKDWAAAQDDLDVFFTRATSLTLDAQTDLLKELVHSICRVAANRSQIGYFQPLFFVRSGLARAMQRVIEDRAASEHGLRIEVTSIIPSMQDSGGTEAYIVAELEKLERQWVDAIVSGGITMTDRPEDIRAKIDQLKTIRAESTLLGGNYYTEQSTPTDARSLAEIIRPLLEFLADTDRLKKVIGISSSTMTTDAGDDAAADEEAKNDKD